ncbi:hypothetical protein M8C21_016289, partial [Ambrosia artemisiifolia]
LTDIQHIAPNNTNLPPTIQIYKPIIINNNKHPCNSTRRSIASTNRTYDVFLSFRFEDNYLPFPILGFIVDQCLAREKHKAE